MPRTTVTLLSAAILILITSFTLGAGRTDVADAAMKGDKAVLRSLIQQKADVNAAQVDGATAVHWAVYKDDADMLDMLIAAGARIDVANRERVTPLHMASLYGHAAIIERLLKAGANVKQKGPAGETMLMLAARNGNPDVIKLLLSAGADVNAREPIRGTTALMWAVEQRHPAAVKTLLDGGADFAMKSGGAGLPRNYMSGKVNTAAVEAAALRQMRAAASGRTYEEQLKIEAWVAGSVARTEASFRSDSKGKASVEANAVVREASAPRTRTRMPLLRLLQTFLKTTMIRTSS